MTKTVELSVGKFMDRHLAGQTREYQYFVARVYLRTMILVLTRAFPCFLRGLYQSLFGTKEKRIDAFLEGAKVWGDSVRRRYKVDLRALNEINIPRSGHLVFSNHVNELDFPFDSYFIHKPYLANQVIKKTLVAYWWMKAMGSEVFDNRNNKSIAISVRRLLRGIKDNSYTVYPEGRNTYSETILPLKKGMVKLAFDHKIPVIIVLKSGIASFQEFQNGNKIAYKSFGIINPIEFNKWEDFRDHIQSVMINGKEELDAESLSDSRFCPL
jgi:1-acyl-sn-glycerol-3-phosphate acyltransferase